MGQQEPIKVGSASDVTNVNATRTNQMYGNLGNYQQQFLSGMGAYTPTANIAALQGVSPQIQSIIGQTIQPYGQGLQDVAQQLSSQAVRDVASQYGQQGALHSGAALSAMTRGAALPAAQAYTSLAQMQSGLAGNLLGGSLGQMGQAYGAQAGLFGQAMQGQTALGAPEWWQPTYLQGGGGLNLGGALGGAAAGAGIGSMIPGIGTGVGAGIGGLIGLLGW
jgi:hypothetical protein